MSGAKWALARLDSTITVVDRLLGFAGSLMLLGVMAIVSSDVLLRYAFNAPLTWSYDLIGVFLMAGIFFFFISDTFRANGHVAVDIVQNRLSQRARHLSLFVVHSIAAAVFLGIFWAGISRAWSSFNAGEVLAGAIPWPVWVAATFVPIGTALLLIRLLMAAIGHLMSAISDSEVVALPPLSGDEGSY